MTKGSAEGEGCIGLIGGGLELPGIASRWRPSPFELEVGSSISWSEGDVPCSSSCCLEGDISCRGSGEGTNSWLRLKKLGRLRNDETEGEVGMGGETGDDVGGPRPDQPGVVEFSMAPRKTCVAGEDDGDCKVGCRRTSLVTAVDL